MNRKIKLKKNNLKIIFNEDIWTHSIQLPINALKQTLQKKK